MADSTLTPEQEKLAAQIADQVEVVGAEPVDRSSDIEHELPQVTVDHVSANLAHLARIADAHRKAQAFPETAVPCLFEWRHLKVESEVGRGGFGTVYRAWDTVLKRRVALKLVSEEMATENRDRLMIAEAQRMARLRHVNILAVHGADIADGRTGIWSDLLSGSTLESVARDKPPLTPLAALELALALTDALALIHRRGIIHGDIKPANIMIQDDGTPVLMDFGAVQGTSKNQPRYGSPVVMAPEQFDHQSASFASDVYSFGVTLFYALKGKYPVNAENYDALQKRHKHGVSIVWSGIPRKWRKLLRKMLEPNPNNRPSAVQVLSRLRTIRAARPRLIKRLATATVMASLAIGAVTAWLAYRTSEQSLERTQRVKDLIIDAIDQTSPNDQSGPATFEATYLRLAELAEDRLVDYPEGLANMRVVAAKGLNFLGQTDKALALARRGHELSKEVLSDSPMDMYDSLIVMTSLLRQSGDLDGAAVAAEQALAELHKMPYDDEGVASKKLTANNQMAAIHGQLGDWHRYADAHGQVLVQRRALHGEGSVRLVVDHHNVAIGTAGFGAYAEAIKHHNAAANLLESAGSGQSVRMGYVIQGFASTLGRSGQHEKALAALDKAEALMAATLPEGHERLVSIGISRARYRYELGGVASSVSQLREVLGQTKAPESNWIKANTFLADMLLDLSQWQEAMERFEAVINNFNPRFISRKPYYDAAIVYCAYRLNPSSKPPLDRIRDSISQMENTGYERLEYFTRLKLWESELLARPRG